MLDWRLKAYRAWLEMEEVDWAKLDMPRDRLPGRLLLRRAQGASPSSAASTRSIPKSCRVYEKLGIPIEEQKVLAGVEGARKVAVDAVFDSVSRRHHLPRGIEAAPASSSSSISEAIREHPELVKKYLGSVVPQRDNYFACLNSAVFSDGTFVYVPEGVRCPMELSHLFPHQRREHRPVRAHADRRRQGQLRLLPRRLHRADARREPAARGGGRDLRARGRRGEILDRPELVSGRRRGQGRDLQFRHQARAVLGRAVARSAGPRSRPAARSPGNIRAAS